MVRVSLGLLYGYEIIKDSLQKEQKWRKENGNLYLYVHSIFSGNITGQNARSTTNLYL